MDHCDSSSGPADGLKLVMESTIIANLERNKGLFGALLSGISQEEYLWKQGPEKWCLLEIVCHLHDEEREDFRTRVRYSLETPDKAPPQFNPVAWVAERNYIEQDYTVMVGKFLDERQSSIDWLKSLSGPAWENAYQNPKFGPRSARMYLANWLAHDYLHVRQINRLRFDFLQQNSQENLEYAGSW